MQVLYILESIRVPVLNELMLLITRLGEETAFLVAALIVYWCLDKKSGYFVLGVGLVGTMANQVLKLACRVPRPWVLDENFTILEEAREAASGYSFPSGHSQSAVGTFGSIAAVIKNKAVRWTCILVAVLVPFSRMYVGVHTPADVLVGSAMALALVFAMKPVVFSADGKYIPWLMGAMLAMSIGFLLYVKLYPFPQDMDAHNLQSGVKNAYTMVGCTCGLLAAYYADKKWIHFSTKAVWWSQLLKIVFGLAAVLAVKEGFRAPLEMIIGDALIARAVRYFLIVIMAGVIWPLTFRFFGKLGGKNAEEKS